METKEQLTVAAWSDLHGYLPNYPECDVAILAGDFSPLRAQRNPDQIHSWIRKEFLPWIKEMPCRKFIFIAGNHDFACEQPDWRARFDESVANAGLQDKVVYLENESYLFEGRTFFGCPYSDIPYWAFSITTGDPNGYKHLIPGIDLLLVHQAPDLEDLGTSLQLRPPQNFGSKKLLREIELAEPKYVVCGHIHTGNHRRVEHNGTTYYNVSFLDENYEPAHEVQTFTI